MTIVSDTAKARKAAKLKAWKQANSDKVAVHNRTYQSRNGQAIRDSQREVIAIDGEGKSLPIWYAHSWQQPKTRGIDPSRYQTFEGSLPLARYISSSWDGKSKPIPTETGIDTSLYRNGAWVAQKHIYTLLMASTGDRISNPNGLSTISCFDFLLSLGKPNRLIVGFAVSYDINMMLGDLPEERLARLYKYGNIRWNGYSITWIPRKQLSIKKGKRSVTVWDIFGYFQSSFAYALEQWKVTDSAAIEAIEHMKQQRGNFSELDDTDIEAYCLSECQLCVKLFEQLMDCCQRVGVRPSRYDGAGSIAASILKREKVKDYLGYPEGITEEIALSSYYGGRFEMRQQGLFDKLYTYDINSAYPSALVDSPCFAHGHFEEREGYVPADIAIYLVEWDLSLHYSRRGFGPFPYRTVSGSIRYPLRGRGYYWSTETLRAIALYPLGVRVTRSFIYRQECTHKPFAFLYDLFQERRALKQQGDLGHLILKLGYNSCYGKTAQNLGGKGKAPTYRNWLVASWTTAHCRSKILDAISKGNGNVISIATDGIISTSPIETLNASSELGEWESHTVTDGFLVHPGIYTYLQDGARVVKSGGFTKREAKVDDLRDSFIRKGPDTEAYYECTRFMTLGAALIRKALDSGWRCWVTESKLIRFHLHNRTIITPSDNPPYRLLESDMLMGSFELSKPFSPKQEWSEEFDAPRFDILSLLLESPD